jgi:hypothetical protein
MEEKDLKEFVSDDRNKNPECNYSYQNQKQSKNINGSYVSEVLNIVTRLCPGKHPVEIYSNSTTESTDKHPKASVLDGGFQSIIEPFAFSMLNKFLKDIEDTTNHQFPKRKDQLVTEAEDTYKYKRIDEKDKEKESKNKPIVGKTSGSVESI